MLGHKLILPAAALIGLPKTKLLLGFDSSIMSRHWSAINIGHTARMGFNPERRYKRSSFDYFFVAATAVAAIGLVVWAVWG